MKARNKHTITVVIAARNEAGGLQQIIQSVRPFSKDIIVVDGHSTDRTKEIAQLEKVRYFLDHKKGRGDALKIGIQQAKEKIILFFDADGSHEAEDIPAVIQPILDDQADLVICSRRTGGSFDAEITLGGMLRSFGSDLLVYFVNKRYGTHFTDIIYSFRAIRTTTAKQLPLVTDGFEIEQEMVIVGIQNNIRITEIPSREKARGWGESKLKTIAGIKLLWHVIKTCYLH